MACAAQGERLECAFEEAWYEEGSLRRVVRWQLPAGDPPEAGWPAVIVYQGTGQPVARSWSGAPADPWGGFWQVDLTRGLLAAGFTVITPGTRWDGTWWATNVPSWSLAWESSRDRKLVDGLLSGIAAGELGPLDPDALFAAGISSGGYMTSRMAEARPGAFSALAIQSASWATCAGILCVLPEELPQRGAPPATQSDRTGRAALFRLAGGSPPPTGCPPPHR